MNKRRIWATSPVYYVMAAVMFIMACFSYTQNKILFAVEITVSGLCLAAVIMTDLHYRVHVYTACAPKAAVCFTLWATRIISGFSAIITKSARSLRLSRLITARS